MQPKKIIEACVIFSFFIVNHILRRILLLIFKTSIKCRRHFSRCYELLSVIKQLQVLFGVWNTSSKKRVLNIHMCLQNLRLQFKPTHQLKPQTCLEQESVFISNRRIVKKRNRRVSLIKIVMSIRISSACYLDTSSDSHAKINDFYMQLQHLPVLSLFLTVIGEKKQLSQFKLKNENC